MKKFYTPVQIGNILGFSSQAIVAMARRGELDSLGPTYVTDKHIRFDPEMTDAFLSQKRPEKRTSEKALHPSIPESVMQNSIASSVGYGPIRIRVYRDYVGIEVASVSSQWVTVYSTEEKDTYVTVTPADIKEKLDAYKQ